MGLAPAASRGPLLWVRAVLARRKCLNMSFSVAAWLQQQSYSGPLPLRHDLAAQPCAPQFETFADLLHSLQPLWLRGRHFIDILNNGRYDSGTDDPIINTDLEIGRMVGGSFIALGAATTDSNGIFDFRFNGGPGGTYYLVNAATKDVVLVFDWPVDVLSHGVVAPLDPPQTSTRTAGTTSRTTRSVTRTVGSGCSSPQLRPLIPPTSENDDPHKDDI